MSPILYSTPIDYRVGENPPTGGGHVTVVLNRRATAVTGHAQPQSFPASIPASQIYFWTRLWQDGERAADEDIARGNVRAFPDAKSAIRWLLEDDE